MGREDDQVFGEAHEDVRGLPPPRGPDQRACGDGRTTGTAARQDRRPGPDGPGQDGHHGQPFGGTPRS